MRRLISILPLFLGVVWLANAADSAPSDAPQMQGAPVPAESPVEPSEAELERAALLRDLRIQRNAEIETVLTAEQLRIEELQDQFTASKSPSEQLTLQRAIAEAKHAMQIDLLDIQARYADLAGESDRAAEIRAQIALLNELHEGRAAATAE